MSKNYKTYYTVRTAIIGADLPGEACFDNKDEAYRFYKEHDYVDKPVAHRVSNPDTIKLFDDPDTRPSVMEQLNEKQNKIKENKNSDIAENKSKTKKEEER